MTDGNSIVPSGTTSTIESITDPNGNALSTADGINFVDTLGMNALQVTNNYPNSISYAYPDSKGTQQTLTVNYAQKTVATQFSCGTINGLKYVDYPPTSAKLVSSIAMPDGTSYVFHYESAGIGSDVTGRVSQIDLATGGSVLYSYTGGSGGIICGDGSTAGLNRTGPDGGLWQYARSGLTTTVTDPAKNQAVSQFGVGEVEIERQVYQGTANGSPLETTITCYNFTSSAPCNTPTGGNPSGSFPPLALTVITTPKGGQSSQRVTYYGESIPFGNGQSQGIDVPTEIDSFDFGASSPSQVKQINYASLGQVLDHPSCVQVSVGAHGRACGNLASNTKSLTKYTYFSNGNLKQTSSWVSGSNYLNRDFTYYSSGLLQTATDVNSTQTSYSYQDCGPDPNHQTQAYVSSVSSGGLTTSYTWDCNGGVLTEVKDANGKPTDYGYVSEGGTPDPYWRVNSVTDALQNVTWKTYTPATSATPATLESALTFNGSASTVDTITSFDGLGRPIQTERRTAPGATTFDNIVQYGYGWTSSGTITGPFSTTLGPGGTVPTTTQLDALGRTATVTDGGGGTVSLTYPQNDVLSAVGPAPSVPTQENLKQRQRQYDAFGRITSACELSSTLPGVGTCTQSSGTPNGYFTTYTYDSPVNSITVTQNVTGTSQRRAYQYDGVGRLTSETNPESGTTAYTYDSDLSGICPGAYAGDLVKRVDNAGNTACYTYDVLHRKLSSTYSGPNPTTNRYFVYDAATVNGQSMANAAGRMAEAYTCCDSKGNKITDEGFGYTALGEQSDFYESTPNSAGYYHVPITYWANGLVKTFGPFLTEDQMGFIPDGEGRAYSLYDFTHQNTMELNSTKYNAAGQPMQLMTSCNGATCYPTTYQYDPNTLRMTQYSAALANGTLTGTLTWNPNGSLQKLVVADSFNSPDAQTCTYSADDLGRIASTSCGSTWGQTFSYDPFGNITKSGSVSWAPGYDSTTNRYALGGTSYDANGDVLKDTFNTYSWDAEGKPLSTAYTSGDGRTWAFVYDAFGHMVELSINGAYQYSYIKLGKFKLSATGQTAAYSEFPLPGGSVFSQNGGATGLQLADWLGTIRMLYSLTGGTGGQTGSHAPFGEAYSYSYGYPGGFTGQGGTGWGQGGDGQMNNTTYWFPERQYRSSQGRWLSPDPAGLSAVDFSNPQSFNRYAYVQNTPLTATDPLGLWCFPYLRNFCNSLGTYEQGLFGSNWNEFDILNLILGDSQTADVTVKIGGVPVNETITTYYNDLSLLGIVDGSTNNWGPDSKGIVGTLPTPQQTRNCLNDYNNSAMGKGMQFFSLYNLATNFKNAWKDWTVYPGIKIAAATGLNSASQAIGNTEFLSVTGGTSTVVTAPTAAGIEATEAVGGELAPMAIVAGTAGDMHMQASCSGFVVPYALRVQ